MDKAIPTLQVTIKNLKLHNSKTLKIREKNISFQNIESELPACNAQTGNGAPTRKCPFQQRLKDPQALWG